MNIFTLFNKGNEHLRKGLNYDCFTSLAQNATDKFRKGGTVENRTIRLTKNGKGIATTTFSGTSGARVNQIASARIAYLQAVENKFGLNARATAEAMLTENGKHKPLSSRVIKAINDKINPEGGSAQREARFIVSQRAVFNRAIQDATDSMKAQYPLADFKLDPVKIEADVIKLLKTDRKTFQLTSQGLASAVAQVVADNIAKSQNADEAKAGEVKQAAIDGVSKTVETTPIPKIHNQEEFVTFFKNLRVDSQYGNVKEDEGAADTDGVQRKTFVFNGIVFRSDGRNMGHRTMKRGFNSQKDLSKAANRIEAMGFGTKNEKGDTIAVGSTGKSGVSCARTVAGSLDYLNSTGTFYVIDTTKLPKGEKAWEMEHNMYGNGLKERTMEKKRIDEDKKGFDHDFNDFRIDDDDQYIEVPFDETKGEVNVSHIPPRRRFSAS